MKSNKLPGAEQVAQRMVNAVNGFIALCEERGFTYDEAVKIFNTYKKVKAIKLDAVHGVYSVVHGAYWDMDVMKRAVEYK